MNTIVLKVVMVHNGTYDKVLYDKVHELCANLKIEFKSREFCSQLYKHDRENIEKLPAFHIYSWGNYEKTIYSDTTTAKTIIESFKTAKDVKPLTTILNESIHKLKRSLSQKRILSSQPGSIS